MRLGQFNETTARELSRALDGLADDNDGMLDGLILDLRNNLGGVLDAAVDISDLFLDAGLIVSANGRSAEFCGADDLTYTNICVAERAGVEIAGEGICGNDGDDPDACGEALDPVCGDDGVTYHNECAASAGGIARFTEGICGARPCPRLFVPVCAADGRTYANACHAERRGLRIDYASIC